MRAYLCSILAFVMPLGILGTIVTACNTEDPVGPSRNVAVSEAGQLAFSPSPLDFGYEATELNLRIRNKGSTGLEWEARSLDGWVDIPESGRIAAGETGRVTVRVSRRNLSAGGHRTSIRFSSMAGIQSVAVILEVAVSPPIDIDATGSKDVTNGLNAFLASLPNGSVVKLPAGARYRAEGVVRLRGKSNITIEGNGALIFATTDGSGVTPPDDIAHLWPRQRSHVEINGSSNIVIRNLRVRGANPKAGSGDGAYVESLEGQHGFDVRAVNGLLLDGVRATDTYGDFVYIGGLGDLGWSQNITVTNSRFERSGRQGIAITAARNVQIRDSYLGEVGRTIIDLEPPTSTGGAQNILFKGNTFGRCRHLLLSSGGRGPNVDDISFIGNHLTEIGLKIRVRASDGSRRQNYRIIDNVSEVPLSLPLAAIRFGFVDGIEVRGNYQVMREERAMTAVSACASTAALVGDNRFPGAVREYHAEATC